MRKIELLAPAGNFEKLEIALAYGADAIYMGGKRFGLRAFSGNFDDEELKEAVRIVHSHGKKAYITVNIFPHNSDLVNLEEYVNYLVSIEADAVIVSDPGIFSIVKKVAPKLEVHISTQANTTNWAATKFWKELGAERVVLARELSFAEIKEISQNVDVELEAFVHGAMCISYSGRCLLSNYLTSRDANRGACTQACRWKYNLVEEKRPGQYIPVYEDDKGTYIFNSKDLCMIEHIPDLMKSGITSFKIEGRMKSTHYVATIVKVYREAIDNYLKNPDNFVVQEHWWDELHKVSHRPYTTGFYYNKTTEEDQIYSGASSVSTHDFIGIVKEYYPETKTALVEQRNNMRIGEQIEIFMPKGKNFIQSITSMINAEGESIEVAPHPLQLVTMPMEQPVLPMAMLRRKIVADE